jgi:hypothetical protein
MKAQTQWLFLGLIGLLILSSTIYLSTTVYAFPSAPTIQYISNSSAAASLVNRTQDMQGTITTIILSANQQDFKWKAYVGNVTGKVALDDANGKTIYDWNLGTAGGGEVYVSRFSNINWASIACVNQTTIDSEDAGLGISASAGDSINATFNYTNTNHRSFNVGVIPISSCRAAATYVNDTAQNLVSTALFQEILLMDTAHSEMVYSTLIESGQKGFDSAQHDFQLLVAENESATAPTPYFFWVELG